MSSPKDVPNQNSPGGTFDPLRPRSGTRRCERGVPVLGEPGQHVDNGACRPLSAACGEDAALVERLGDSRAPHLSELQRGWATYSLELYSVGEESRVEALTEVPDHSCVFRRCLWV
jgi:hypothetical protein